MLLWVYIHTGQAWKICLATVGIEPKTFGILAQICSVNWKKSWLLDYIDIEGTRFCSEILGRGLCGQIVSFRDPPLRNRKFLHNKNPYYYLSVQKKFPSKIPAHSREMFIQSLRNRSLIFWPPFWIIEFWVMVFSEIYSLQSLSTRFSPKLGKIRAGYRLADFLNSLLRDIKSALKSK
jgi:hypothetical protein